MPYAKALASGEADLNRCPPGGESTIAALAALLNLPVKPVDPNCGTTIERHIASIHPQHCIGCTLCIKACPVDAIVGSSKRRHAVLTFADEFSRSAQAKILFGTQPSTAPPTFVLFTSGKLEASYERFIERRLREEFGFVGTPIVLQQRVRVSP